MVKGAQKMGFDRVALRNDFVQNTPIFETFDEVLIVDFQNDKRIYLVI